MTQLPPNNDWSQSPQNNSPEITNFRYATFQHRLGGYALDAVLAGLTLGIGWFIWALIVWGNGQTPAKQILKLRTFDATTGRPASWGLMALREFLVPMTVGIASFFTGGLAWIGWIVVEIVFYFNKGNRTLRDYWVKTAVVNEA
jgi:uncharacterized RDD family membrane protein YckC